MATRGVYTEEEKKMLANFEARANSMAGWAKQISRRVATRESIHNMATAVDLWNPLWRDENYAANTRWGGVIAPPLYTHCVMHQTWWPEIPPSVGYRGGAWLGEDWEFFKPVRVNDSFRVWRRPPQLEDMTRPDGKGPRMFKFTAHDVDVINQKDELVNTFRSLHELVILPEPPQPKKVAIAPDYSYTKEELEFLDRIAGEEKIRGAEIRYWEDVSVGEEVTPVTIGPTTIWDMIVLIAGMGGDALLPMRELRKRIPAGMLSLDPDTGVTHHVIEHHFWDRAAQLRGRPHAFHFGNTARQLIARCVSNWMGDDGFLRKFNWRHLEVTHIGDSVICRGRVTGKRIEKGEHLVEMSLWCENLRGNITEPATATVRLVSKEAPSKME